MESSKYYLLFKEGNISSSILDEKLKDVSFEDHYWHMACLAKYYESINDKYLEKAALGKLCDLNYAYASLIYFEKLEVLPSKFKQYTKAFSNNMKDDYIENRIVWYNKSEKKVNVKSFILYGSTSILVIPLMFFLVYVCKCTTDLAMIISVIFLLATQFIFNPFMSKRKIDKNASIIDNKLRNYMNYYERFVPLLKNEKYIALIKAKNEYKREKIIEDIKKTL